VTTRVVSAEELARHNSKETGLWIQIDESVYDVSEFAKRHPGGDKLLHLYGGQDATDAFHAFHVQPARSYAIMKGLVVGAVDSSVAVTPLVKDFRRLRLQLREQGFFEASVAFYMLWFAHVVAMELAAAWLAYSEHSLAVRFVLCSVLLAVAQVQAGWLQHDFGHLSVFKTRRLNDWWHWITIMALKGASASWWKTRHNRHHGKTNVIGGDPDIDNDPLFLIGEEMVAVRKGWQFSEYQSVYWHLLGPPLVTSLLFIYQNVIFMRRRKLYSEMAWSVSYLLRFALTFMPAFGVGGGLTLYFAMRVIESHWFTWITSMSHLPMQIGADKHDDWIAHTMATTQNLTPGLLSDWFTGHLNYQVEHHLFPTMPRHHYPAVNKEVHALAQRHGLTLRTRPLVGAMQDVLDALAKTGAQIAAKKAAAKAQ
jgi:fatty acid desaturase/predicted heme/steroid binding protein